MAKDAVLYTALPASAPFLRFEQARKRLDADTHARSLLSDLAAAQADLRTRQAHGPLTSNEIDRLRALQAEARANALIGEYIQAQNDAAAYLKVANQEISQWLGVDFAGLARQSGCC